MNRRTALKSLAGIISLLTPGIAMAKPGPPKVDSPEDISYILVSMLIHMDDKTLTQVDGPQGTVSPSSKMIDQVSKAIDAQLNGKDYAPALEKPVTIEFSGHEGLPDRVLTVDAEQFFKRRGLIVNQALNLHCAQTAAEAVDSLGSGPDVLKRVRAFTKQVRDTTDVVRIQFFALPVTSRISG